MMTSLKSEISLMILIQTNEMLPTRAGTRMEAESDLGMEMEPTRVEPRAETRVEAEIELEMVPRAEPRAETRVAVWEKAKEMMLVKKQ